MHSEIAELWYEAEANRFERKAREALGTAQIFRELVAIIKASPDDERLQAGVQQAALQAIDRELASASATAAAT